MRQNLRLKGLMMSKLIYLLVIIFTLSACASMSEEELELERQKLALMNAIATQPTIRCEQGCEYTDPRRNLATLFPKETNGWDFANTVLKTVTSTAVAVAPWAAVATIAADGIKNAGGNYQYTDSYNTHSEQNSSDTTTTETTTTTTTTETNTTTTTENSNNDSSDNSTTTTTTETSTQTDDNSDNSTTTTTTEPPSGNT